MRTSKAPGRTATLDFGKAAMWLYQRSAFGYLGPGGEIALKTEMSFCVGMTPSMYVDVAISFSRAARSV